MSDRTASGYLFGGLASSRAGAVHLADACSPAASRRGLQRRRAARLARDPGLPAGGAGARGDGGNNIVVELDGRPAMPLLLEDLGISDLANARAALPRLRRTLVGLSDGDAPLGPGRQFRPDVRVRHLIGLDPGRKAVALADLVEPGMRLAFCARDAEAARARPGAHLQRDPRGGREAPSEAGTPPAARRAPVPAASRIRARCTSAALAAAGRISAALRRAEDRAARSATMPLAGFSPAAIDRATTSTATPPACSRSSPSTLNAAWQPRLPPLPLARRPSRPARYAKRERRRRRTARRRAR